MNAIPQDDFIPAGAAPRPASARRSARSAPAEDSNAVRLMIDADEPAADMPRNVTLEDSEDDPAPANVPERETPGESVSGQPAVADHAMPAATDPAATNPDNADRAATDAEFAPAFEPAAAPSASRGEAAEPQSEPYIEPLGGLEVGPRDGPNGWSQREPQGEPQGEMQTAGRRASDEATAIPSAASLSPGAAAAGSAPQSREWEAGLPPTSDSANRALRRSRQAMQRVGMPAQLSEIAVTLSVQIGSHRLPLRDLLAVEPGQLVPLDRMTSEPVDIFVNGRPFARGEVVAIGDRFGVRLLDMVEADDAG